MDPSPATGAAIGRRGITRCPFGGTLSSRKKINLYHLHLLSHRQADCGCSHGRNVVDKLRVKHVLVDLYLLEGIEYFHLESDFIRQYLLQPVNVGSTTRDQNPVNVGILGGSL